MDKSPPRNPAVLLPDELFNENEDFQCLTDINQSRFLEANVGHGHSNKRIDPSLRSGRQKRLGMNKSRLQNSHSDDNI